VVLFVIHYYVLVPSNFSSFSGTLRYFISALYIFPSSSLISTEKYGMTGNGSQDGMVFYRKLSQWYTKKEDDNTPKLIAV